MKRTRCTRVTGTPWLVTPREGEELVGYRKTSGTEENMWSLVHDTEVSDDRGPGI